MNAKEISDATLESVTPADNDLMLIYDTSEGTTGTATIADIAPKVAEKIDIAPKVAEKIVPRSGWGSIILQDSTLSSPLNFTASFSGLFFITLSKSTSGNTVTLFVNGTRVFQTANFVEAYSNVLFAFVRQGDSVVVQTDDNGGDFYIQTAGLQKIDWIIEA